MADLGETAEPNCQRARLGRRCALAGSDHRQRIGRQFKKHVRGSTSPDESAEDLEKRKDGRYY